MNNIRIPESFEKYETVKKLNIQVYNQIRNEIHCGCTERQLYHIVEETYLSKTNGQAEYQGDFLSGKRTCGIEGPATDKVIEKGDTVIVDTLCAFGGAYCDTTRTFFGRKPTDEQVKVYDVLVKVLEETSKMLKPGIQANQIFNYMNKRLIEEGYGGLAHHAGHGLKNSWYEEPYFIKECNTVLEENMLVALEPGIYIPEQFGIRIENNYRVTKSGGEDVFGYTLKMEDFIID